MEKIKQKVLVILGPTASGKSELGVRLAKKFNGEIISADSRQVYKGLDIGTGKITKHEMRGVPHHLLDVADPKRQFSVAQYKVFADKFVRYIVHKGKLPIIVGGAGFYIDALAGKVVLPNVPPNKLLRDKLDRFSKEKLFKILRKKDPRKAKSIDPNNKVRLIRALEIIKAIGKIPRCQPATLTPYKFVYIGLKPDNLDKKIYERLLKRLGAMIREGKILHKQGLTYKRMHELGLEYRYVALYLQGKLNKLDMFNKLNKEIRHYSKRQMTWFKRNKKIKWFEPQEFKKITEYARMQLLGD